MKKAFALILITALIGTTFSCKDKETPVTVDPGTKFAKVDGNDWNASVMAAVYFQSLGSTTISATGMNTSDAFSFSLEGSETGSYNLDTFDNAAGFFTGNDWYYAESGKMIITKYDKTSGKISGTFYFEAKNGEGAVKHITEGSFTDIALTTTK